MEQMGNTRSDPQGFGITTRWGWIVVTITVKMLDVTIPLHEVVMMEITSLLIPPLDAFQRLGFSVLDVFLESLGVCSLNRSHRGAVVGLAAQQHTV